MKRILEGFRSQKIIPPQHRSAECISCLRLCANAGWLSFLSCCSQHHYPHRSSRVTRVDVKQSRANLAPKDTNLRPFTGFCDVLCFAWHQTEKQLAIRCRQLIVNIYKRALCFQVGDLVRGTHNLKLVVPGGPWWSLVVPGGPWWSLVVPGGPWWSLVVPGGPPWHTEPPLVQHLSNIHCAIPALQLAVALLGLLVGGCPASIDAADLHQRSTRKSPTSGSVSHSSSNIQ